jgi:hypothetical protein
MPSRCRYRIIVEKYEADKNIPEIIPVEDIEVTEIQTIFDLGFRHEKQIEISNLPLKV